MRQLPHQPTMPSAPDKRRNGRPVLMQFVAVTVKGVGGPGGYLPINRSGIFFSKERPSSYSELGPTCWPAGALERVRDSSEFNVRVFSRRYLSRGK